MRRPDGSWLVDGTLDVDTFRDLFRVAELPEGDYHTAAGLVLAGLGRIPAVAETLRVGRPAIGGRRHGRPTRR